MGADRSAEALTSQPIFLRPLSVAHGPKARGAKLAWPKTSFSGYASLPDGYGRFLIGSAKTRRSSPSVSMAQAR